MHICHLQVDVRASVESSVHMRQRRSPRLGIVFPSATSYSIPRKDWRDGSLGVLEHIDLGIAVSHAPVSAVSSTSIHSSLTPPAELSIAFVSAE